MRLTAPNPGVFTGPGTNTYLIGQEKVIVLDPGPNMPGHIEAILAAASGRITAIVLTHTHPDHAPAAAPLAQRCGNIPILGMRQKGEELWQPEHPLKDGDTVSYGDLALKVIHTPGHASNHLCYLLKDAGILFSGDHIIQSSTVVISPPDGNMREYMDSLHRLRELRLTALASGHGTIMANPQKAVAHLIAHRMKREKKVLEQLKTQERAASIAELVPLVYDDVGSHLHAIAAHSLEAHLLKLHDDGRASVQGERWYRLS